MQKPLVEIRDVINRFGHQTVHDGVNLTMCEGEILGLVGGSGSGKSVLLRTILGLNKPQQGQVCVFGKDRYAIDDRERKELEMNWGVLFQDGALFSGLNVLDNIGLPMREYTNLAQKDIDRLSQFKLKAVGLTSDAGRKFPSALSGGMNRRAALARALSLDPCLLFLDEPTGALDPVSAAAFDDLIRSLRDALNLSVLIITHDLDTLTGICDRIAMLADKKVTVGTLEEMRASANPEIRNFFHGKRMEARLKGAA